MPAATWLDRIPRSLATDVEDPAKRRTAAHQRIHARQQERLQQLPRTQVLAFVGTEHGTADAGGCPGFHLVDPAAVQPRPTSSNVRGLAEPCTTVAPAWTAAIPRRRVFLEGQALNITLVNNASNLAFGLVGCRRSVPHLQRLLAHLESSLTDLEAAVGL